MTGIRECQALLSLRMINRSLQQLILQRPSDAETETFFSSKSSSIQCPVNVTPELWTALRKEYNDSQLAAIHRVCAQYSDKKSSITLLQGPPGTGKTKTILGLVAVFLSGSLSQENRSKVKIIPGASLKGRNQSPTSTRGPRLINNIQSNTSSTRLTASKPRVLLCAPSNIAVDELVFRLITQAQSPCITIQYVNIN